MDLGECLKADCSDAQPDESHSHALMYVKGVVEPGVVEMMKQTITRLGFVGELDFEEISLETFGKRMKKEALRQKLARRKTRIDQNLKDSLEGIHYQKIKHA